MICTKCSVDKTPKEFRLRINSKTRDSICIQCIDKYREIRKNDHETPRSKDIKINTMKNLIKEIIEACEANNGRRLRLCIEKARLEIKGVKGVQDENELQSL